MTDHKSLSFTAFLQIAGCPLNTLGSICKGPVILTSPIDGHGPGLDGSRALGMLDCTDEDWELGKDTGLITFDKGPDALPLLLYFRHFDNGYRLYVRSGKHFGEGIFSNANGMITVQPITDRDPGLWKLIDIQSGRPFDLARCEGSECGVQMASAEGHPVEARYIYPVGAFLASYPAAHQGDVTLIIQEREVDWLSAG